MFNKLKELEEELKRARKNNHAAIKEQEVYLGHI